MSLLFSLFNCAIIS